MLHDAGNVGEMHSMPVLVKSALNNLPTGMLDALILTLTDVNFLRLCETQEEYFKSALANEAMSDFSNKPKIDQLRMRAKFWADLRAELTNYETMMGV